MENGETASEDARTFLRHGPYLKGAPELTCSATAKNALEQTLIPDLLTQLTFINFLQISIIFMANCSCLHHLGASRDM